MHLPHAALPQLLLPYVYGPIFGFTDPTGTLSGIWGNVGGYLSTSLLLFGLLGLVSPGRRGLRVILLSWIMLALARIYGEPPGLGVVLGVLPGMSHVEFYRYADPALELAVIVLAALGMDSLTAQSAPGGRLLAVTLVSFAVVAAATIGAVPLAHRLASRRPSRLLERICYLGCRGCRRGRLSPRSSLAPELAGSSPRRLSLLMRSCCSYSLSCRRRGA